MSHTEQIGWVVRQYDASVDDNRGGYLESTARYYRSEEAAEAFAEAQNAKLLIAIRARELKAYDDAFAKFVLDNARYAALSREGLAAGLNPPVQPEPYVQRAELPKWFRGDPVLRWDVDIFEVEWEDDES